MTRNLKPEAPSQSRRNVFIGLLILIGLAGLAVRIWAAAQASIVNPDAAVYIHQARAIHFGAWVALGATAVQYLSPYPLLISVARCFSPDWIVAAKTVSIVSGTLAFLLVYPLSRFFFRSTTSLLLTLIFAFHPLFVSTSALVVKDSLALCFLAAGAWLLVRQLQGWHPVLLLGSSLLFLLAAWSRIEALLAIPATLFFLAAFGGESKWKRAGLFSIPPAILVAGLLVLALVAGLGEPLWARLKEFGPRFELMVAGYQNLREGLRGLAHDPPGGIPSEYFDQIRSITWLAGAGVVLRNFLEAFHMPLVPILILGLFGLRAAVKNDPRIWYFLVLVSTWLIFLYFFIFSCWVLEQRWIAAAILFLFPVLGCGLEKIHRWCGRWVPKRERFVAPALAVLLTALTIPKSLAARDRDKAVFLEIAQTINALESGDRPVEILASGSTIRWLSFYTNLHLPVGPSPDEFFYDRKNSRKLSANHEDFLRFLNENSINYVLWVEREWPPNAVDFPTLHNPKQMEKNGLWFHKDTGKMILYHVRKL